MKKFIKIFFITILAIIIIAIALPFVFKGKVLNIAKTEINKSVNAKVEFSDLKLSLIKGFPNLFIGLEDLSVVGIDEFEKDTLVSFEEFSVKVDLLSAISKQIKVKSILLKHPVMHAIKTQEGIANWDIAKETEGVEEVEEIDTTTSEPVDMKVALKKFAITDAYIYFDDDSSNMSAAVEDLDFELSGDLAEDFTTILINTTIKALSVKMDGIKYIKDATVDVKIDVDADMVNGIYTLKDNTFGINEIVLGMDGSVAMPDTINTDVDLKFYTKDTEFKSLLSMIPAVYMTDFEDVETDGTLKLEGYIKGTYNDKTMPSAELELKVDDARFNYPDLPKSVENINLDVDLFYDGADDDNTKVDVNKFHIELADNPIDFMMKIRTPISDPDVEAKLVGKIDHASVADVVPLEETTIKGIVDANIFMAGKMSMIDNEQYQDFEADGQFGLQGIKYSSPDVPAPVKIDQALMIFSTKYVDLTKFDMTIGKSDMHFKGKFENFIPYVFSDGIIKGNLDFTSSMLDVNEFMPEEVEEAEETGTVEDTVELATVEIPGNIDFKFTTSLTKVIYDELTISNIKGLVKVIDSKAILDLKMNMLQGSMEMKGVEYNTQDKKKPTVHFNLDINKIDIPSAFDAFVMVQTIAPMAENAVGQISLNVDFNGLIDDKMSPILSSVDGFGDFSTNNVLIKDSKTLNKIGEGLKTNKFENMELENVKAGFEIKEGRLYLTDPIKTTFEGNELTMTGSQGIDQTMDYKLDFAIPRSGLGAEANKAIGSLTEKAASKGLNIPESENIFVQCNLGGTFTDPKVTLNLKESVNSVVEDVKEEIKEKVKEEVKEVVDDAKAKASAEAQKIIAKAEKEAAAVKAAAKKSADEVRVEADKQYNKAVAEANKLPKLARKPLIEAAKAAKNKTYKKADDIETTADKKSQGIKNAAKKKADSL